MIYAFCLERQYKAMGTALLCIIFSGIADTNPTGLSERRTRRGSWTHAIGTVGLGAVGVGDDAIEARLRLLEICAAVATKHRTKSHGTALMKPPIGIVKAFAKD
jgi:hypothetical protein